MSSPQSPRLPEVESPPLVSVLLLSLVLSCSKPPVFTPTKVLSNDAVAEVDGDTTHVGPDLGQDSGEAESPGELAPGEVMAGEITAPAPNPIPGPSPGEVPAPASPVVNPQVPTPTVPNTKYSLLFVAGGSAKVEVYRFDKSTGATTLLAMNTTAGSAPTFLAIDAPRKRLFAIDESASTLSSFSIAPSTGLMTKINQVAISGGPAHVSVDTEGKWVYTASYGDGYVYAAPVMSNGMVGLPTGIIAGRNAHQAFIAPGGKQLLVPCLGSNYISRYDLSKGTFTAAGTVAAGTGGPRHLAAHSNGKWLYLMNETTSTVQAFTYVGTTLALNGEPVSALSAVPAGGNTGAEIQVHPNGKYVYSSNRGDDSIAIFSIGSSGLLTLKKTVKTGATQPRHFAIDPSGKWMSVAHQSGNAVTILALDPDTGDLTSKGTSISFPQAEFAEIVDFVD